MSYVPWIKLKKCGITVGVKMVAFREFERIIHPFNPTKTLTKTRIFDPKRMNLRTFSKNIASMYCVRRDKKLGKAFKAKVQPRMVKNSR